MLAKFLTGFAVLPLALLVQVNSAQAQTTWRSEVVHTNRWTNILGYTGLTYNQRLQWVWRGNQVLSSSVLNRWGTVHVPFWEFVGHREQNSWISGSSRVHFTQGHFKGCIAYKVGCFQNAYSTITSRLSAGSSSFTVARAGGGNQIARASAPTGASFSRMSFSADSASSEDLDSTSQFARLFYSENPDEDYWSDESTEEVAFTLVNDDTFEPIDSSAEPIDSSSAVPEPTTIAGVLAASSVVLARKRLKKQNA